MKPQQVLQLDRSREGENEGEDLWWGGEGTGPIEGQRAHYQEMKLETMDKGQYESLNKDANAKA